MLPLPSSHLKSPPLFSSFGWFFLSSIQRRPLHMARPSHRPEAPHACFFPPYIWKRFRRDSPETEIPAFSRLPLLHCGSLFLCYLFRIDRSRTKNAAVSLCSIILLFFSPSPVPASSRKGLPCPSINSGQPPPSGPAAVMRSHRRSTQKGSSKGRSSPHPVLSFPPRPCQYNWLFLASYYHASADSSCANPAAPPGFCMPFFRTFFRRRLLNQCSSEVGICCYGAPEFRSSLQKSCRIRITKPAPESLCSGLYPFLTPSLERK